MEKFTSVYKFETPMSETVKERVGTHKEMIYCCYTCKMMTYEEARICDVGCSFHCDVNHYRHACRNWCRGEHMKPMADNPLIKVDISYSEVPNEFKIVRDVYKLEE